MHDNQLEDRLRTALRAEGDGLSMTITAAELQRRLAGRQRQEHGRRLATVAAVIAFAAVGAVAAMSNGWLRLPAVGVSPSPSATVTPGPSETPADSATPPAQTGPCPAIDALALQVPIELTLGTASDGDQYGGTMGAYRIGTTAFGSLGQYDNPAPEAGTVPVGDPTDALEVRADDVDACINAVFAEAVPIAEIDGERIELANDNGDPTRFKSFAAPPPGSWVVRIQAYFATGRGTAWTETFFKVDVAEPEPEPTPEPTLGPPPSLPDDLARTAWLQVKGDLYRYGQFGYRGSGNTNPLFRTASVDGDHVAYITEDGVSRLSVYPVRDQSPDAIGPTAGVDAQPGNKLGGVWLDDRHGQLFYSVGSEELAAGLTFHRLGITDADQTDTVVVTVSPPFGVDGPPLGGMSAALSADRSAFVVEICAEIGRCQLQIVDTTTLKVTTKTVTTDKSVCDIIGIVDGQVFTTTADVCKGDYTGAPGAIQVVPLAGGTARTVIDGYAFDAIAIPTEGGPRLVYTRDVNGSGQSLWVADPATGIGEVPFEAFKPSGSTHVEADRASNLPPGWLLIRRVDPDGNGVGVPQLISLDTGVTYDLPNVPR